MKLPQFDGKNMAVKTFIDNMRGCRAVKGWSEEASVVHLTNQIQDPLPSSFEVSRKKGSDTPSMMFAAHSRRPLVAQVQRRTFRRS